jgi:tripartite-type tricarboxylate transporter receptor subunit TctC
MSIQRLKVAFAAAALLIASGASAQPYPNKPVRIIVPYPAGGVVDIMARIIAERIGSSWGQQVLVEPKPGANGMIGTELVLNAPADGYTWLLASTSHVSNAALYPDLRWDPVRDFAAAGLFARSLNFFVVPSSLPVQSVKDYVALAKSQPGKLNYGNPGNGTPPHLAFELFKHVAGIDVQVIGYKGFPPIVPDLISGRLSATMLSAPLTIGQAKSGNIRLLAVLNEKRVKEFPEVPTLAEAGYGEAQLTSWFGVVLPGKTPRDIVQRVGEEIDKAVKTPEMADRLEKSGGVSSYLGPADFQALMAKEVPIWTRVVKQAGIKAQ